MEGLPDNDDNTRFLDDSSAGRGCCCGRFWPFVLCVVVVGCPGRHPKTQKTKTRQYGLWVFQTAPLPVYNLFYTGSCATQTLEEQSLDGFFVQESPQ